MLSAAASRRLRRNSKAKKGNWRERNVPGKEMTSVLEQLILGKSRVAAKGIARKAGGEHEGEKAPLVSVDCVTQREEGLYLVGQAAALHDRIRTIRDLHDDITVKASRKLASLVRHEKSPESRNRSLRTLP